MCRNGKAGGERIGDFDRADSVRDFDPSSVNLEEDPGYKFRLQEGLKAIRRGAAAGSGARGGATLKALTRFGQESASQEYQSAYNRAVGRYQMDRGADSDRYKRDLTSYQIGRENIAHEPRL